ncbi:MAG: NADH-quinone oxidoreductase subunit NuoK [Candidatus Acidiferrales bacterium]
MIPVEHYLAFGFVLFAIGAGGALMRRNPIMILMSIELMLTAVNVNLIAFSRMWGAVHGQLFSLFIMTDAAAETALALAILVACNSRPRITESIKSESDEITGQNLANEPFNPDAEVRDVPVEGPVL